MKKLILIEFAILVCMLGILTMPALAAEQDQKMNYVKANLGVYQPTGKLDDSNYDSGPGFSLVYGRYLNSNISIEAGMDVFASEKNSSGSNSTAGTYDREDILIGNGLTFTIKGEYPTGPVRLYGGAGFGLNAATMVTEIDSSNRGKNDESDSDFIASAHVLAGIDFDINYRWFINLEGKYRVTDDADINKTVGSVPVAYKGDMDGYSITVGFGFRF